MKKLFIWVLSLGLFASAVFAADATIAVVNRASNAPKIAIEDASEKVNSAIKERFFRMVITDLKASAAFNVVDKQLAAGYTDSFVNKENAAFILRYQLVEKDGLSVRYTVSSTKNGAKFEGTFQQNSEAKFPYLSHSMVSAVTKKLSLGNVEWMNRSVIVSYYTENGESEIAVGDYTLSYLNVVVKGGLNLFPKWANAAQTAFYYTAFPKGAPTLYRYDIANKKRDYITSSKGMLVATDVSANGDKVLLTMSPNDNSDIYMYDFNTGVLKQISKYSGSDLGAVFAENEKKIYFVSERLGFPTIFATNLAGTVTDQVVMHGKNNFALTARGNYAVYASRESRNEGDEPTFNLYLVSTKSDYVRQLTPNGYNVQPRFSADAKAVLYVKKVGSQFALALIRIDENKGLTFPLSVSKMQSFDW